MTTRCFVAINLPGEIKKELDFLIEKLKEKNQSREIKWVKPESIHLTLHFLGSLEEKRIEQVKKIIQKCIVGSVPTEIELKDLNGFPNLEQPRVLFIAGQEKGENKSLQKLQIKIGQELKKIGLEVDHRLWQIHFTLARLKVPQKINVTRSLPHDSCFQVKSIDLMKSELTPYGAKYGVLKSFSIK